MFLLYESLPEWFGDVEPTGSAPASPGSHLGSPPMAVGFALAPECILFYV